MAFPFNSIYNGNFAIVFKWYYCIAILPNYPLKGDTLPTVYVSNCYFPSILANFALYQMFVNCLIKYSFQKCFK